MTFEKKGIWNSGIKKPSYGLWRHKTDLSQIVTSQLIFRNSETLDWKNKKNKTELCNSEILLNTKFSRYLTLLFYFIFFILKFPSYVTLKFYFH